MRPSAGGRTVVKGVIGTFGNVNDSTPFTLLFASKKGVMFGGKHAPFLGCLF